MKIKINPSPPDSHLCRLVSAIAPLFLFTQILQYNFFCCLRFSHALLPPQPAHSMPSSTAPWTSTADKRFVPLPPSWKLSPSGILKGLWPNDFGSPLLSLNVMGFCPNKVVLCFPPTYKMFYWEVVKGWSEVFGGPSFFPPGSVSD